MSLLPNEKAKQKEGYSKWFYQELVVSNGNFSSVSNPDIVIRFRGGVNYKIFICTAGSVEYSFNGTSVHGAMSAAGNDAKLDLRLHPGNTIWFKGSGTVRVHAWAHG